MGRFFNRSERPKGGECGREITEARRSVDDSDFSGKVFCGESCFIKHSRQLDESRQGTAQAGEEE